MSNLLALLDLTDVALLPLVLVATQRLVESLIFVVAAGVSLWSRNPARRAEARRLMRLLRRGGSDDP